METFVIIILSEEVQMK